jgi:hypothetical protein
MSGSMHDLLGLVYGLAVGISLGLTGGGGSIFAVPAQPPVNWWYAHNVLDLWFTPVGLAAAYYFIPKIIGEPIHSYTCRWPAFGRWHFFTPGMGCITSPLRQAARRRIPQRTITAVRSKDFRGTSQKRRCISRRTVKIEPAKLPGDFRSLQLI